MNSVVEHSYSMHMGKQPKNLNLGFDFSFNQEQAKLLLNSQNTNQTTNIDKQQVKYMYPSFQNSNFQSLNTTQL